MIIMKYIVIYCRLVEEFTTNVFIFLVIFFANILSIYILLFCFSYSLYILLQMI